MDSKLDFDKWYNDLKQVRDQLPEKSAEHRILSMFMAAMILNRVGMPQFLKLFVNLADFIDAAKPQNTEFDRMRKARFN